MTTIIFFKIIITVIFSYTLIKFLLNSLRVYKVEEKERQAFIKWYKSSGGRDRRSERR